MLRISQAGKKPRFISDLVDALWIGDLMQRDNPCDPVFFEQEMHGKLVPCGCLKALAPKPDGIWCGAIFGTYYRSGDDGTTRELTWAELLEARQRPIAVPPVKESFLVETLTKCGWSLSGSTKQELRDWEARRTARKDEDIAPILRNALVQTERGELIDVLRACDWNVSSASKQLGLPRTSLLSRMERLSIIPPSKLAGRCVRY